MSNNDEFENLRIVYRTINNAQAKRTNLRIIEKDRIIGTWEANDVEDIPILWYGSKENLVYIKKIWADGQEKTVIFLRTGKFTKRRKKNI